MKQKNPNNKYWFDKFNIVFMEFKKEMNKEIWTVKEKIVIPLWKYKFI